MGTVLSEELTYKELSEKRQEEQTKWKISLLGYANDVNLVSTNRALYL